MVLPINWVFEGKWFFPNNFGVNKYFQKIIMHLEEETEKSSKYFKKLTQTGKLTNVMYFFCY